MLLFDFWVMQMIRNQFDVVDARQARKFLFLLGLVFYVLAIVDFFDGSESSLSGRWGWVKGMALQIIGPYGVIVFYVLVGTALIISAVLWKRS